MVLTQANGHRTLTFSDEHLLGARERHALPEGEPPRARGAGDLGPAKAESPALFFFAHEFVTLYRAPPPGQVGATRVGSRGQVCRLIPLCPSPETAAPICRQSGG
jgi:hypothetical protein